MFRKLRCGPIFGYWCECVLRLCCGYLPGKRRSDKLLHLSGRKIHCPHRDRVFELRCGHLPSVHWWCQLQQLCAGNLLCCRLDCMFQVSRGLLRLRCGVSKLHCLRDWQVRGRDRRYCFW